MTPAEMMAMYAELEKLDKPLKYCSVCGTDVEPYNPGSISASEYYDSGSAPKPGPGDTYRCPTCDCDRIAMSLNDDHMPCPVCERPNPPGNAFCAWSGDPLK